MSATDWPAGMHELHCREDRCVFGCDCPCHRGEPVPVAPEAPDTQTLNARINALSYEERTWVLYWLASDLDPGRRAVLGDALDHQHIVAQKQRSG